MNDYLYQKEIKVLSISHIINGFLKLTLSNENLIITRTLSKSYSLAGLRVGYALASREIVSILNKAREVYNVDRIAQVIAQSALEDREYFNNIINKIISVREKVYAILKDWRWITYQSGANFLFNMILQAFRQLMPEKIPPKRLFLPFRN